jgi:hypothetical protein
LDWNVTAFGMQPFVHRHLPLTIKPTDAGTASSRTQTTNTVDINRFMRPTKIFFIARIFKKIIYRENRGGDFGEQSLSLDDGGDDDLEVRR